MNNHLSRMNAKECVGYRMANKNTSQKETVDLLGPSSEVLRKNYIHQIETTISSYSHSLIVVGEALQNSIDAICREPKPSKGEITLRIDFDENKVVIQDNGIGFPKDSSLLFLGGSDKSSIPKSKGSIGVGIKVVLFSSRFFSVKSKPKDGVPWKCEVRDMCNFEAHSGPLNAVIHEGTDIPIKSESGTQVEYILKDTLLSSFIEEMKNKCFSKKRAKKGDFHDTIEQLVSYKPREYPSPIAALLSVFLRRFSYVGDVQTSLGGNTSTLPNNGIELKVILKSKKPFADFTKEEWNKIFGETHEQEFLIPTEYLHVEKIISSLPKHESIPSIAYDSDLDHLNLGGKNMREKVVNKFHFSILASKKLAGGKFDYSDYEKLLEDSSGDLPDPEIMKMYRDKLFPHINGIVLTIGHIPHFDRYLPGGSDKIISCNGIVTDHDIKITGGRNIDYTRRCFDLIIDVDAKLDYGKKSLARNKYNYLLKYVSDYADSAYKRVIQTAAKKWTGRQIIDNYEDEDLYVKREDIGLEDFVLKKEPKDENDVIALFFEMCGKGIISFDYYRVFGLSSKSKYDGKAALRTEKDDKKKLDPEDDTKLKNIEFKIHASSLIEDFKDDMKEAKDLELLVAWDIGKSNKSSEYDLYKIEDTELKKVFPRATWVIKSLQGKRIQVILLKDIVDELKMKQKQKENVVKPSKSQ